MSWKIGKDNDYVGGTFLRKVDKTLQNVGFSRDGSFMQIYHKAEHKRREFIARINGDTATAEAERKRASENIKY